MNRHERRANMKKLLPILQERPCGPCTACCTVLRVDAIRKVPGERCKHERAAPAPPGCSIHARRPPECKAFFCAWRVGFTARDERPDLVGYLMYAPGTDTSVTWFATRDVRPGAGWNARARIEALALERRVAIAICTPFTDEIRAAAGELRNAEKDGYPENGQPVTLWFGPPAAVQRAEAAFLTSRGDLR